MVQFIGLFVDFVDVSVAFLAFFVKPRVVFEENHQAHELTAESVVEMGVKWRKFGVNFSQHPLSIFAIFNLSPLNLARNCRIRNLIVGCQKKGFADDDGQTRIALERQIQIIVFGF